MAIINPNDLITITEPTKSEINEVVDNLIEGIKLRPNVNLSCLEASAMGFRCELVGGLFLISAELLEKTKYELFEKFNMAKNDDGFDYELHDLETGNVVFIDVKGAVIKKRWSDHTKVNHDLKLHRFKNNRPRDFVYLFISEYEPENPSDKTLYRVEGCCTQGEILDNIANGAILPAFYPQLIFAKTEYRGYIQDNDMVVIPNNWLPHAGTTKTMEFLKKQLFCKTLKKDSLN